MFGEFARAAPILFIGALVVHLFNVLLEPPYEVYYSAYLSAVAAAVVVALEREARRRG
jgi:hypothetical protein